MHTNPTREAAALPRFYVDRIVELPEGCWKWCGYVNRHGYGQTGGRLIHRLTYELLVGPIPPGLQIDHLCRNRGCVNPAHMEPVTNAENQARGLAATKTHCVNGHAYDDENTYRRTARSTGVRYCRACNRRSAAAYRERRKAA